MLRLKLVRSGRAQSNSWRLVVQPDREKLNGTVVQNLGLVAGPKRDQVKVDKSKLKYWLQKGAIPTASVAKILGLS